MSSNVLFVTYLTTVEWEYDGIKNGEKQKEVAVKNVGNNSEICVQELSKTTGKRRSFLQHHFNISSTVGKHTYQLFKQ